MSCQPIEGSSFFETKSIFANVECEGTPAFLGFTLLNIVAAFLSNYVFSLRQQQRRMLLKVPRYMAGRESDRWRNRVLQISLPHRSRSGSLPCPSRLYYHDEPLAAPHHGCSLDSLRLPALRVQFCNHRQVRHPQLPQRSRRYSIVCLRENSCSQRTRRGKGKGKSTEAPSARHSCF